MPSLLYPEESYQVRSAIYEVWKQFGSAFKEVVIDKALAISLQKRGLHVDRQLQIPIYFEGQKVGTYVPDQIVSDKILLELKAKPMLTVEDKRQFWHYLKGSKYRLGFLINFGTRLEIVRRVYDTARDRHWLSSAQERR